MTSTDLCRLSDIFNICFPEFAMSEKRFSELLSVSSAEIICKFVETEVSAVSECSEKGVGETALACSGFAIADGNAIRLICVHPDFRGRGIGSSLLKEAEEAVKAKGHDKAILGGTSSGFMIGADERVWSFFEKRGYSQTASATEMLMHLKDFELSKYSFRGSEEAKFGWYRDFVERGEISELFDGSSQEAVAEQERKVLEVSAMRILHEAVRSVDETWVPLYTGLDNVYVGIVDGRIASFCTVELDAQNYLTDKHGRVGMPGCVGTVPEFRKRGIALEMVAYATQFLKEQRMDVSFIYFTRVAPFYEKIGYETFLEEVFAEKRL